MKGISAETYVRRWAEDELRVDPDGDGPPRRFWERIRVLYFVGLLDADVASAIVSGYERARALRGLGGYYNDQPDPGAQLAEAARMARCTGEIDISGTTVVPRLAILGENRTRVAVTVRPTSGGGQRQRLRHHPSFFDVGEISLGDDKGRSVTAHFSGGGGGTEWRGWYEAVPGLSPDTAWIEVEGARVVLDDNRAGASVTAETLAHKEVPIAERAARYLDHCAHTSLADYEPETLAIIADTLVTCGALPADSPAVTSVLGADQNGAPHPIGMGGGGWRGFQPPHPRRGRRSATVSVLVGATTPSIDGVSIVVTELEITSEGLQIEIDGAGPVEIGHGHSAKLTTPRLSIGASDDLGNRYRGSLGEFEQGAENFSGTVRFAPALDAAASIVNLEFSTERARAIMHVPLQRSGQP